MQFLKLTKNITGKVIRVNPIHVIDIEEGEMKEDPEAKGSANAKSNDKNKDKEKPPPQAVTIIRLAENKTLFVKETPDEIDAQVIKIKAIRIEL